MNDSDCAASESLKSVLGAILLLTSVFYLNFVGRVIPGPLMPLIEKDLGIGHAQAGALFFFLSLGYFITLFGSSAVAAWLEHRRIVAISALWVGVALLMVGLSHSLWGLRLGFLNMGMAAGLYLPSGIAALTALVNPRLWGRAIAIHELAPSLGFFSAPLISEALLPWTSWRGVILSLAGLAFLVGFAFARFGQGGRFKGQLPKPRVIVQIIKNPSVWIVSAIFALALGCGMGIYGLLPLYLVSEHSYARPTANLVVALSRLSGFIMIFLAGWLSDRLGPRRTLIGVLATVGIITVLLGQADGNWLLVLVFLQPPLAACFYSPSFAAIGFLSRTETRHVVVSLALAVAVALGGGVLPAGIGFLGEMGHFGWGITGVGVLVLGGLLAMPFLKFSSGSSEKTES